MANWENLTITRNSLLTKQIRIYKILHCPHRQSTTSMRIGIPQEGEQTIQRWLAQVRWMMGGMGSVEGETTLPLFLQLGNTHLQPTSAHDWSTTQLRGKGSVISDTHRQQVSGTPAYTIIFMSHLSESTKIISFKNFHEACILHMYCMYTLNHSQIQRQKQTAFCEPFRPELQSCMGRWAPRNCIIFEKKV